MMQVQNNDVIAMTLRTSKLSMGPPSLPCSLIITIYILLHDISKTSPSLHFNHPPFDTLQHLSCVAKYVLENKFFRVICVCECMYLYERTSCTSTLESKEHHVCIYLTMHLCGTMYRNMLYWCFLFVEFVRSLVQAMENGKILTLRRSEVSMWMV